MVDTHAHVHDGRFDDDRDAMIARARAAGVADIITVGCDLEDTERALRAAERYGIAATLGIHPHEAKDAPTDIGAAFERLRASSTARIVAVGETGLDYYYNHSLVKDQIRVLEAQLAYAERNGFPVVFHQRDAFDDFVAVMRERWNRTTMRGVIHCFTGSADEARTFVEEFGLLLGIGGVVTFKTAAGLRDAVRAVGLAPLLLETDAPYLAPIPHRGKRNESAFMIESARKVAELLALDETAVIAATTANARRLFGLAA